MPDENCCRECGRIPDYFADELARVEFKISGLCEACQNRAYNMEQRSS